MKRPTKPRAGNAVDFWVFAGNPSHDSSFTSRSLEKLATIHATPGLLFMPIRRGEFNLRGVTTFLSRNQVATTSQIGSPDTPSVTGAQPATL